MPIEISLSDFADFIMKVGTAQLTKVHQLATRDSYHPSTDFWKGVRDAIQHFHRSGGTDRHFLEKPLEGLHDRKKRNCYPDAISGYKRFLGRKSIQHFTPPKETWTFEDLQVKINPELGLLINGKRFLVKLHFKEDAIDQQNLKLVFALMRMCLHGAEEHRGISMAVLDVRKGKLHIEKKFDPDLVVLLEAQAKSFIHMWNSGEKPPPSRVA